MPDVCSDYTVTYCVGNSQLQTGHGETKHVQALLKFANKCAWPWRMLAQS